MKIDRLKLVGSIGIKKGLGLETLDLDLSGLSGLIALAGPNGRGKTSVLDSLSPFRTLGSRKGALQHHFYLRQSSKELSFTWNGNHYRTLVKIDAESEKQEGYIWKDGTPQVKGKVREYDRVIRELMGSEELFFNSVFASQNGTKLSDLTTGQLKNLFSEFLRLHRYEEWEATAKQVITLLDTLKAQEDRQAEHLEKLTVDRPFTRESLEAAQARNAQEGRFLSALRDDLTVVEGQHLVAIQAAEANKGIRQRIADLEGQKTKAEKERTDDDRKTKAVLQEIKTKTATVLQEIEAVSRVLADKDKIMGAVEEERTLKEKIEKANENGTSAQEELTTLRANLAEKEKAHTKAQGDLRSLTQDPEIKVMEGKIGSLKHQAAGLAVLTGCPLERPTCSLTAAALEAKEKIQPLEDELTDLKARTAAMIEGKHIEIGHMEKDLKADRLIIQEKADRLQTLKSAVADARKRLFTVSALAAQSTQIAVAAEKLTALRARQAELTDESLKVQKEWTERDHRAMFALKELEDRIMAARLDLDAEADERVKELTQRVNETKTIICETEGKISETQALILSLENKLKEIEGHTKLLKTIREKRDRIIQEAGRWAYLRDACGKDGLRALEIDSVAPTISAYANDLLSRTFGPLFSVRFRTQNDEGKEVLDILVIRDDGSEVLLEDLSGGEKVWLLKSLRLSMTLVSKEKSGRMFGTCLCDEEDGALDVENGQNFIRLYQSFMQSGGFESCYFISHKPECVSMADHVLMFNGKGVDIE